MSNQRVSRRNKSKTFTSGKFCRCIVHASKNYPNYNPYAVCTSRVSGRGSGRIECGDYLTNTLGFDNFETSELRGYAKLKKIRNADKMTRNQLIRSLYNYYTNKGF